MHTKDVLLHLRYDILFCLSCNICHIN
jgi:hypothetical protein